MDAGPAPAAIVPMTVTLDWTPLRRADERVFVEAMASAVHDQDGDPPVAPVFHAFDEQPGVYVVVVIVGDPDFPESGERPERLFREVEAGLRSGSKYPLLVEPCDARRALEAGHTADRLYSVAGGWRDRHAEAGELEQMLHGTSRGAGAGAQITADAVLAALGSLGRAPIMVDPPTDRDLPRLLGVLMAAVEQAAFLEGAEGGDLDRFTAEVNTGYLAQLGGADDGGTMGLAVMSGRFTLLTKLIANNFGDPERSGPILTAAAKTSQATTALLQLETAARIGERDDAELRQVLHAVKKDLQAARQSYEDLVRKLRRGGADI